MDESIRPDRSREFQLLKSKELLRTSCVKRPKNRTSRRKQPGIGSSALSSARTVFSLHLIQVAPTAHQQKRSIFPRPPKSPLYPTHRRCHAIASPTRSCCWHLFARRHG